MNNTVALNKLAEDINFNFRKTYEEFEKLKARVRKLENKQRSD